jgi:LytS/YehU family sensor histidine kinase
MQTMLPVSPTSRAAADATRHSPNTGSLIAGARTAPMTEPRVEGLEPFHRSLVVRLWVGMVLSISAFEYVELHDKTSIEAPLWVYALLIVTWPLLPLIFLPVVRAMTIRFPLGQLDLRGAAAHVAALTVLTLIDLSWRPFFTLVSPLPLPYSGDHSWAIRADILSYIAIALMFELARMARRHRALEMARTTLGVQVAEARRRRTEAELRALKAELNPHFLGNALASVAALLETDVHAADRALAQIGELLGRLGRRPAHEVTMAEELEGLEPVLEYERLRLSGRLTVERELADDARDALLPDMILHPLVENAVKYGLAPRGGGTLRIAAVRDGDTLVISVHDRGSREMPAGATQTHGVGIGLSNVRSRLAELYGARARLELLPDGTQGMEARVTLPWRDGSEAPVDPLGDEPELGAPSPVATDGRSALRARLRGLAASALFIAIPVAVWWMVANLYMQLSSKDALSRNLATSPLGIGIDMSITVGLHVVILLTAFEIARRFVGRGISLRWVHLLVPLGFGLLGIANKVAVILAFTPQRMHAMPWSHLMMHMVREVMFNYMLYGAMIGAVTAVTTVRQARWTRASRLRLHLRLEEERQRRAAAELRALESELNPHFVGNALGVVSSLIRTDRAAARQVLEELGTLLRAALSRATTHEVTLREELATLRSFLAVEHARLGRRLDIHWRVDEATLDERVPHMILQPLVENAVKHGLAPHHMAGRIDVEARRADRELELVVRDDGVGLPHSGDGGVAGRKGVGLANTRARLSELYGPLARLELSRGDPGGTVARVRIPWRSDPDAEFALAAGGAAPMPMIRPADRSA